MDSKQKLDTIAELLKECDNLDFDECVEAMNEMDAETNDFEVGDYRFIEQSDIDEIMQDELGNDRYMLGCFTDWFLADILGTSPEAIKKMQEAEAFEGIGEMVLAANKLEELQSEYVSQDGYGHHFAHYDGHSHEVGTYYAFKVN